MVHRWYKSIYEYRIVNGRMNNIIFATIWAVYLTKQHFIKSSSLVPQSNIWCQRKRSHLSPEHSWLLHFDACLISVSFWCDSFLIMSLHFCFLKLHNGMLILFLSCICICLSFLNCFDKRIMWLFNFCLHRLTCAHPLLDQRKERIDSLWTHRMDYHIRSWQSLSINCSLNVALSGLKQN